MRAAAVGCGRCWLRLLLAAAAVGCGRCWLRLLLDTRAHSDASVVQIALYAFFACPGWLDPWDGMSVPAARRSRQRARQPHSAERARLQGAPSAAMDSTARACLSTICLATRSG